MERNEQTPPLEQQQQQRVAPMPPRVVEIEDSPEKPEHRQGAPIIEQSPEIKIHVDSAVDSEMAGGTFWLLPGPVATVSEPKRAEPKTRQSRGHRAKPE